MSCPLKLKWYFTLFFPYKCCIVLFHQDQLHNFVIIQVFIPSSTRGQREVEGKHIIEISLMNWHVLKGWQSRWEYFHSVLRCLHFKPDGKQRGTCANFWNLRNHFPCSSSFLPLFPVMLRYSTSGQQILFFLRKTATKSLFYGDFTVSRMTDTHTDPFPTCLQYSKRIPNKTFLKGKILTL